MPAARNSAAKAKDPDELDENQDAPAPEPAPEEPAKPVNPLAHNLEIADEAVEARQGGYATVLHHLEVAFVHALAGAKDKALERLEAAEGEIERVAPALDHLVSQLALLKARVHAVLSRK